MGLSMLDELGHDDDAEHRHHFYATANLLELEDVVDWLPLNFRRGNLL